MAATMSKDAMEFEAAKIALAKQPYSPYVLWPIDEKLVFRIHNRETGKMVPGVVYDPFHIGPAMAMRDALNEAWRRAQAQVSRDFKELAKDSKTMTALTNVQRLAIEGLVDSAARNGTLKAGYVMSDVGVSAE